MRHKLSILSVFVGFVFVVGLAAPAYARNGADDTSESSGTSEVEHEAGESESESRSSVERSQELQQKRERREKKTATKVEKASGEREAEAKHEKHTELHAKGQAYLGQVAEKKQRTLTVEQRQKVCEARKDTLQTKVNRIVTRAGNQQSRYDDVLAKATTYKTAQNSSVADWDALYATAQAKQATAAASVNSLLAVKPTVDCTSSELVSSMATFKEATKQAKKDLAQYRHSVVLLLAKLEEAKPITTEAQ